MSSANVEIYTGPHCPYCDRAKQLLKQKNISYKEINIGGDPSLRDEMIARTQGKRTVPQIFINDQHIGGCDDLYALNQAGKLDGLL